MNQNDLISRQAAINETWKMPSYTDPMNVLTELRERIEALPSAQQWILCSERLPDKDGRYLTTNSMIGKWIVDWNIWTNEPKPSWLYNHGVIAWMPLPEPYKEVEHE